VDQGLVRRPAGVPAWLRGAAGVAMQDLGHDALYLYTESGSGARAGQADSGHRRPGRSLASPTGTSALRRPPGQSCRAESRSASRYIDRRHHAELRERPGERSPTRLMREWSLGLPRAPHRFGILHAYPIGGDMDGCGVLVPAIRRAALAAPVMTRRATWPMTTRARTRPRADFGQYPGMPDGRPAVIPPGGRHHRAGVRSRA
jgi:hypothetical protein